MKKILISALFALSLLQGDSIAQTYKIDLSITAPSGQKQDSKNFALAALINNDGNLQTFSEQVSEVFRNLLNGFSAEFMGQMLPSGQNFKNFILNDPNITAMVSTVAQGAFNEQIPAEQHFGENKKIIFSKNFHQPIWNVDYEENIPIAGPGVSQEIVVSVHLKKIIPQD
jgi:hypothetical protein